MGINQCKECGKCCQAIVLGLSPEMIFNTKNKTGDLDFVYRNWKPISKEKALKINPYLATWKGEYGVDTWYYECKFFCSISKKCIVHDIKPYVCREFPYYGRKDHCSLYTKECGYQK